MLTWLRNKLLPNESKPEAPMEETKPKRAKNKKGKFVADNPETPFNEAWVDGKAPEKVKKPRKPYTRKKKVENEGTD